MATVPCRACGNPVNPAASECPHCGAVDPAPASAADDTAGERVEKTAKGIGCVALSLVALVLAVVVALLAWIL